MAELALDDVDRHAVARELDCVGVAQLMGRESAADPFCFGRRRAGSRSEEVGSPSTEERFRMSRQGLDTVRLENRRGGSHRKGRVMHVVIRSYSGQGASDLFDLAGQRADDLKTIISGVPGFVSFAAFRTDGGGVAVTVCQDKKGADESSRRAAGWVKENFSTTVDPAAITEGSTFLQF